MAGGQPISMENLRATYELCRQHGILVMLDATRAVENAHFIKEREAGYQDQSIAEILEEICSYSDGATVSSKKDNLVNIGGFLALRDGELARKARALLVAFEGLHTYGGMSGRDMDALATGIREMVATDDHVRARVGQVEYLGTRIMKLGLPIVHPIGGHGVFIDAASTLPHLDQEQFPAQALTAAIYRDSGVRGMERGAVSAGRDPRTGEEPPTSVGIGAAHASPPGLHPSAHGRRGRVRRGGIRKPGVHSRIYGSPTNPTNCASFRLASKRSDAGSP